MENFLLIPLLKIEDAILHFVASFCPNTGCVVHATLGLPSLSPSAQGGCKCEQFRSSDNMCRILPLPAGSNIVHDTHRL